MSWWGDSIRALRRLEGLSQRQLSKRSGISLQMISYYENDRYEPRIGVFDEILYALGYKMTIEKIREGDEHD